MSKEREAQAHWIGQHMFRAMASALDEATHAGIKMSYDDTGIRLMRTAADEALKGLIASGRYRFNDPTVAVEPTNDGRGVRVEFTVGPFGEPLLSGIITRGEDH